MEDNNMRKCNHDCYSSSSPFSFLIVLISSPTGARKLETGEAHLNGKAQKFLDVHHDNSVGCFNNNTQR